MRPANGFTLTELLISLFIFGLIAAASTASLSLAFTTGDEITAQSERQRALAVARALIKSDMTQVVSRPARDRFGGLDPFGFAGGLSLAGSGDLLIFSRLGWVNPGGRLARGSTQRVHYRLEGGRLIRRFPLRTDPAPDTEMREQLLFDGVAEAGVEFYANGAWQPSWQSTGLVSANLPAAMRLSLAFDDGSTLRQLFLLTGARP